MTDSEEHEGAGGGTGIEWQDGSDGGHGGTGTDSQEGSGGHG